ncbi:MAG TPA: riboflavin kinase [Ilumatobacteraceae bacterium]|jgi:riboflavin kinase/FMN adenylyltransferase
MNAAAAPILVVGEFDGFHLGHRQLVHSALSIARRSEAPVVGIVIVDRRVPGTLTTVDERCWALLASGASSAMVISVEPMADTRLGAELVDEIVARLRPAAVVMACLPDDTANARYPSLRGEFHRAGIEVVEVERWHNPDGQFITSAGIRDALRTGEIAQANDWLGRTFTLSGIVVHGSGLGRTIGFPTANLRLDPGALIPMNGVYAADVDLATGGQRRGAVNIGVRPTIESNGAVLVEAHLLDFDGDLYGSRISVGFRRWLRNEQRFDSVDALVAQLGRDVEQTRLVLRS